MIICLCKWQDKENEAMPSGWQEEQMIIIHEQMAVKIVNISCKGTKIFGQIFWFLYKRMFILKKKIRAKHI